MPNLPGYLIADLVILEFRAAASNVWLWKPLMTASYHIDASAPRTVRLKAFLHGQAQAVASLIVACAVWLIAKAVGVVQAFQMARLLSTLVELRDDQLKSLGITRSDIPQYALKLMTDDHASD